MITPGRVARNAALVACTTMALAAVAHGAGPTRLQRREKGAPVGAQSTGELRRSGVSSAATVNGTKRAARTSPLLVADAPSSFDLPAARTADADRLAAMQRRNAEGADPPQIGFLRPLPEPVDVTIDASMRSSDGDINQNGIVRGGDGNIAWVTAVGVRDAQRFRLLLSNVRLSPGTEIWTYGDDRRAIGPLTAVDVASDGTLLCPSIFGSRGAIECHVPVAELDEGCTVVFQIEGVMEIFDANGAPSTDDAEKTTGSSCLVPVSCAGELPAAVQDAEPAIGRIEFRRGSGAYLCSGALLNDRRDDLIPYFLTANHCISTASEASSVEVFWDYLSTSCGQSPPSLSSVARSVGGQLMNADGYSDFSLLRLNDAPGGPRGRSYLGWTVIDADPAATRYRLHHPSGHEMHYSVLAPRCTEPFCSGAVPPSFLYHDTLYGGAEGGSSGAPIFVTDGGHESYVIGQLLGTCSLGPNDDVCGLRRVDGSFRATFPAIRQFLDPDGEICRSGDTLMFEGQTLGGSLDGFECPTYARQAGGDWFRFTASAGSEFEITMTSPEFDTYLEVLNPCGVIVAQDDDSAGATDSRIIYRATVSGQHTISASSFGGNVQGSYAVTLLRGNSAIPAAPINVATSNVKKKKLTLSWVDNSDNEMEFVVAFWNGTAWQDFGSLGANTTSTKVTGLSRRTTYFFTVKARNSAGSSEYAPFVTVTTR